MLPIVDSVVEPSRCEAKIDDAKPVAAESWGFDMYKVAHLVAHPGQKKPLNPLQESAAFMYWLRGQDLNL